MGINLLSYPYVDSTITRGDITFTDLGNGSLSAQGTKSGAAYIRLESYDTLTLEAGTYTMRGTGYSYLAYTVELKPTEGTSTYLDVDASNKTFTVSESVTVRVDLDVSAVRGTEIPRTVVYPQLEAGTELSPWTPYRPPTTIDAENAKQIRQTMDVIIQVTPEQGEPIVINNSNLISCTVSLRSDLSIIEPTLPESEINIEAYFDDDISDVLASIPDETPVTYQAGYPGDMSPVRNFYLAEQITWQDNVMSIHAVDAVHKLDEDLPAAIRAGVIQNGAGFGVNATLMSTYGFFCFVLGSVGIVPTEFVTSIDRPPNPGANYMQRLVVSRSSKREIIAKMMNLFHIDDFPTGHFLGGQNEFWLTFVDAGIPTVAIEKPDSSYDIYEEDCGDVKKNTEREITGLDVTYYGLSEESSARRELGTCTWKKGTGVFFSTDTQYADHFTTEYIISRTGTSVVSRAIPPTYDGAPEEYHYNPGHATYGDGTRESYSAYLAGPDIPKGLILGSTTATEGLEWNSQVMPWNAKQETQWNAIYGSERTDDGEISVYGYAYEPEIKKQTYGSSGNKAQFENDLFFGMVQSRSTTSAGGATLEVYPSKCFNSLLSRSNITGSFTWKGDPRMQPRDVVTFHRLDGTTEDITIENITITHEKGGTSAEITYRCGIC